MSRNLRLLFAIVLIVGAFAFRYFREHRAAAHDSATASHGVASAPVPKRMLGRIAFTPCTLAPQFGATSVEAQCTSLAVAENPALPQGRRIDLHIAWVPADEDGSTEPDPVFMLAGGPGQAATESYPQVAPAFRDVLKKRNVILVDQRGTGGSNPLLCEDEQKDDAQGAAAIEAAPPA